MIFKGFEEVGFFEGTEKLLEIWFEQDLNSASASSIQGDLRRIPRHELDELLNVVRAEIVSVTYNEFIDSYVLSESSMFISKDRFIIKTCGIIRLLDAIQPLILLARKYAQMSAIQNFFYSRRVYLRPEEQLGIHQCFNDEVNYLKNIIPNGNAYTLGSDPSKQWYLFTMDNVSHGPPVKDATLEILMSDLDHESMVEFTKIKNPTLDKLLQSTGISHIIPGSINDGLIFEPIGFSLNGLFRDSYYTIHVTPQPQCSYVSFETNLRVKNYDQLINRVLSIFKPGRFILTLFTNKSFNQTACKILDQGSINGYECDDSNSQQLKNYSLAYRHYVKTKLY